MNACLATTALFFAFSLPEAYGQVLSEASGEQNQPAVSESKLEVIPLPSAEPACDVLNLAYFENMALANNPTLVQANAGIQAARGRRLQAGLYPNPEAGYIASEIGDEGEAGQQGAFVAQEFVRGQKLGLSQQVATEEVRQGVQELEAQRLRVLTDTRQAFYSLLVAQESVRISAEVATIADQAVNASSDLLEAQETGRVDLLQAQVELESARISLTNATARHLASWRRLTAITGLPGLAPSRAVGDLHGPIQELAWEEALGTVLSSSPELAAARAGVSRSRWALRRARAEPIPNVDVQSSVQYDYATGDTIAGVQVGLPLPLFNRNQGGIREAYADVIAAGAEVGRVELALQERLALVFEQYSRAKNQVEKYSSEILPNAKRSLELVSLGYQGGEYNFLTLLTAQRTFTQANLAYLSALDEMWSSAIEIDGLLLVDSLQSSPGN